MVLEGTVRESSLMQVQSQASDPRHGLASGAINGAGVGAKIQGPPAGAKGIQLKARGD